MKNQVIKFPEILPEKKGLVIPFPVKNNFAPSMTFSQNYGKFISDRDFKDVGIAEHDLLICKVNFDLSEITPQTVCIIEIKDLRGAFPTQIEIIDENTFKFAPRDRRVKHRPQPIERIKILGIAVEVRRFL